MRLFSSPGILLAAVSASVVLHGIILGLLVALGGRSPASPPSAETPVAPHALPAPAPDAKPVPETKPAPEVKPVSSPKPSTGPAPRLVAHKPPKPQPRKHEPTKPVVQDLRRETSLEDALDKTTDLEPVRRTTEAKVREEPLDEPPPTTSAKAKPLPAPVAQPALRVYRVRQGDTLTRLARACGCTPADLARLNGTDLRTLNRLLVGQRIKLPAGSDARAVPSSRSGASPNNR